jgi:hypothetical protein
MKTANINRGGDMKSISAILTAFVLLALSFTFSSCKDCGKKGTGTTGNTIGPKPGDNAATPEPNNNNTKRPELTHQEQKEQMAKDLEKDVKIELELVKAQHIALDKLLDVVHRRTGGRWLPNINEQNTCSNRVGGDEKSGKSSENGKGQEYRCISKYEGVYV